MVDRRRAVTLDVSYEMLGWLCTAMTPYIAAERATLNTEGVSDQGEVHRFRAVPSCLVAPGWR